MMAFWLEQGEYLLRIRDESERMTSIIEDILKISSLERSPVVAGGWSLAMIAASASLLMIVSKYGFFDLLPQEGIGLDPSRVAAGLMTAIGFLGSLIFVHKQTVVGLPTAVVIWATVGVGMAIGAGMYVVGIFSALLMTALYALPSKSASLVKTPMAQRLTARLIWNEAALETLWRALESNHIQVISYTIARQEQNFLMVELYVSFPTGFSLPQVLNLLSSIPCIQSIKL